MRVSQAYSTLGIQPGASLRQATGAYRELAKHYHPDMGGTSERFREIQKAYAKVRPLLKSGSEPVHVDVYA
jgi:DnaJ-class molecular chaperone